MDGSSQTGPVLQRRLNQRSGPSIARLLTLAVTGIVVLGGLGVVVAASLPGVDLFGLYAARATVAGGEGEKSSTPSPTTEHRPAAPAPAPAPEPAPPVNHSPGFAELNPEKQPEAEPVVPEVKPTEEDGEPAAPPTPGNERPPSRDAATLAEMPKVVDLPKINDVGDTTLSYLHEASHIKYDMLSIMEGLAALGEGEHFHVERVPRKNRWTIHFVRPGQDAAAGTIIAEMWTRPAAIMFKWRPDATSIPAAEQLRNTALRITAGNHHQTLALRKPLLQKDVMLDLTNRTMEVDCPIAYPPQPQTLYFELLGVDQFPIGAAYHGDKKRVAVPRATETAEVKPAGKPTVARPAPVKPSVGAPANNPAKASAKGLVVEPVSQKSPAAGKKSPAGAKTPVEPADVPAKEADSANSEPQDASKIIVNFDKFSTGQQPQLWVEPVFDSSKGKVTFSVAGVLMRGKIRDDLTPKNLSVFRTPREKQLASVERDRNNMHDEAVLIDRRIGELKADPGTNAGAIVKSRSEIKRMQGRLPIVQKEFKKLDEEMNRLKAELTWVAAADHLIQVINKAVVLQYRVYAKSGDLEIDLVRSEPN